MGRSFLNGRCCSGLEDLVLTRWWYAESAGLAPRTTARQSFGTFVSGREGNRSIGERHGL